MDCIPADALGDHVLPFLSLRDIVRLDSAAARHDLRAHIHCALKGHPAHTAQPILVVEAAARWFQSRSCYPVKATVTGRAYQLLCIANCRVLHFRGFPRSGHALSYATRIIKRAKHAHFEDCAVAGFPNSLQGLLDCSGSQLLLLKVDNTESLNSSNFVAIFSRLVSIKTLILRKATSVDAVALNALVTTVSTSLEHLTIGGATQPVWTDSILNALTSRCHGLQTVSLDWCGNISTEGVAKLAADCPCLRNLHLKCQGSAQPVVLHIREPAFRALADHCPDLASLGISHHYTDDATLLYLARGCRKLHRLQLKSDAITDTGLADLARNGPLLQMFAVTGTSRFTDVGVAALAQGCPALRSLVLSGAGAYTAQCLAQVGLHCTSLESLRWEYNNADIPAQCVAALGQHTLALRIVSFSYCSFLTDDAVAALVDNCPTLQELHLTECVRLTNVAVLTLFERAHALQKLVVGRILPATKATFAATRPAVVVL